jgi:hypothetical protein
VDKNSLHTTYKEKYAGRIESIKRKFDGRE